MKNFISKLTIQNYKSILNAELECSKINIFIGRPNVGKSNLLEAISLLSQPSGENFFSDYLLYDEISDLYYDHKTDNTIFVFADNHFAALKKFKSTKNYGYFSKLSKSEFDILDIDNYDNIDNFLSVFSKKLKEERKDKEAGFMKVAPNGSTHQFILDSKILNYKFERITDYTEPSEFNLNPPYGNNLFKIIQTNDELRDDLVQYLKSYNLEIVYVFRDGSFKIQKKQNGVVYETPYLLVADTIQRIVFYSAAIYSNNNSILLFEEPEVNSFPPYIQKLAQKIVDDESNQFFISTHSPYLLNHLLEKSSGDLSLFIVDYKNHQSTFKKLKNDELEHLLNYGTDIFFNIDKFL